MWVVFYTERSNTGKKSQQWAENVYLTDFWEVYETKEQAVEKYKSLTKEDSTHNAGIAPISEEYSTDW